MNNTCKAANHLLGVLLHIFILFAVLCTLFLLVVSKLEKSKFQEEINTLATEQLLPALRKHPDANMKAILSHLDFEKLKAYYSQESDKVKITNHWLIITMVLINVFLFILILTINFTARRCINLTYLIAENAAIFLFVGIFEYVFFKNIASKYVPVNPSEFQTLVYKNLWR